MGEFGKREAIQLIKEKNIDINCQDEVFFDLILKSYNNIFVGKKGRKDSIVLYDIDWRFRESVGFIGDGS